MIVYLTGGIGTGKSTVLRLFGELGATTASADDIVRALYTESRVQVQVAGLLGLPLPLDRAAVAAIVFADAEQRTRLEALLHPLVWERTDALRRALGPGETLVYEIPLPPSPRPGDLVVAVTAPDRIRLQRLLARGMSEPDARARLAAQPAPDVYGKQADFTIVNDGDIVTLRDAVTAIWEDVRRGASTV